MRNQNGKYLELQSDIIQVRHMVKRDNSFFPKGGHSATITELNIICIYIRWRHHRNSHKKKTSNRLTEGL